jgi:hypothetical protein
MAYGEKPLEMGVDKPMVSSENNADFRKNEKLSKKS